MIEPVYRAQAELLLRVLPTVGEEERFALKGGTAINLFVRDMPRLSVARLKTNKLKHAEQLAALVAALHLSD